MSIDGTNQARGNNNNWRLDAWVLALRKNTIGIMAGAEFAKSSVAFDLESL